MRLADRFVYCSPADTCCRRHRSTRPRRRTHRRPRPRRRPRRRHCCSYRRSCCLMFV